MIKYRGTRKRTCLISSYKGTLLNIKIKGIITIDNKIVPKYNLLISLKNIFFSVNGSNNKPIIIMMGNFTISQEKIYVESS